MYLATAESRGPARGQPIIEKLDRLVSPALARRIAAVATGLAVALCGAILLGVGPGRHVSDFSAQLVGGRIALAGDWVQLYDRAHQHAVMDALVGPGQPENVFMSPPFMALAWAPYALAPYNVASALWALTSALLFLISWKLIWPLAPRLKTYGRLGLWLGAAAGPTAVNLATGQDGALSLLIAAGGLRLLLARRDLAAGTLLGLGVFKPQLFLLFPVVLLLERRWRALIAWTVTASLLAGVSVAMVGLDGVAQYRQLLGDPAYQTALASTLGLKTTSLTAVIRGWIPASATIALSMGAVLIGSVVLIGARPRSTRAAFGLATLLTLLVAPQAFGYDQMLLLIPAVLLLEERSGSPGVRAIFALIYVLQITWPLRAMFLESQAFPVVLLAWSWTAVPIAALVLLVSDLRLPWRAVEAPAALARSTQATG
jgi:hypothetical protein